MQHALRAGAAASVAEAHFRNALIVFTLVIVLGVIASAVRTLALMSRLRRAGRSNLGRIQCLAGAGPGSG